MGGMGRSAPGHYQLAPAPQTSGHAGYPLPPSSIGPEGASAGGQSAGNAWNPGNQSWQTSQGHMVMQPDSSGAYSSGSGSYGSSQHHAHAQSSREGLGRIQLAPLRGQGSSPPPGGSADGDRGKKSNNPLSIGNMVD